MAARTLRWGWLVAAAGVAVACRGCSVRHGDGSGEAPPSAIRRSSPSEHQVRVLAKFPIGASISQSVRSLDSRRIAIMIRGLEERGLERSSAREWVVNVEPDGVARTLERERAGRFGAWNTGQLMWEAGGRTLLVEGDEGGSSGRSWWFRIDPLRPSPRFSLDKNVIPGPGNEDSDGSRSVFQPVFNSKGDLGFRLARQFSLFEGERETDEPTSAPVDRRGSFNLSPDRTALVDHRGHLLITDWRNVCFSESCEASIVGGWLMVRWNGLVYATRGRHGTGEGRLAFPGVGEAFPAIVVASPDATCVPVAAIDNATVLLWVQDATGARLCLVRP